MAPEVHEKYTRTLCARCLRPRTVCYCSQITEIATRTRVLILQHPRERHVPINTARIAALCLPASTLRISLDFSGDEALARALRDRAHPAVLLYPSAEAIDPEICPPEHPVTLIVIDGTWPQAEKILSVNPALRSLPCYALAPSAPSRYRIRREPAENYVCTLEALAAMLSVLEGDPTISERLLAPFDLMVDTQLRYAETVHTSRHRASGSPRKAPAPRYVPTVLLERPEELVYVWGEASAWPAREAPAPEPTLVHWIAERTDGSRFEAFMRPVGPLSPVFEQHTHLDPERVFAGESLESFHARWKDFLCPGETLVTWGHFALELLRRRGVSVSQSLDLRDAVKRHLHAKVGPIENALTLMGAHSEAPWAAGRAGHRLAALRSIARAFTPPA